MKGYGQFCPVAKASEVIGERWTALIIRELICGDASFNDIRKGVPLMSPSLLSKRLKTLESTGVIERHESTSGVSYSLTEAGEELRPIIMKLGAWGQRWARSDMSRKDLDPSLLMWDMHRRIDTSVFPKSRTVLLFEFTDYTSKMRRWWLVVHKGEVDICLKDPGHDVDMHVVTSLRTMAEIWMGDISVNKARNDDRLTVHGPTALKRSMSSWLGLSVFAGVKPA